MQTVDLPAEVTLAPGGVVEVKDARLSVRFVEVTTDSRCPRDAACIWAGEVKVLLEVHDSRSTSRVELAEGGSTTAGGCRMMLLRVEPQTTSKAKIAPLDYRVTLKLDRLTSQ